MGLKGLHDNDFIDAIHSEGEMPALAKGFRMGSEIDVSRMENMISVVHFDGQSGATHRSWYRGTGY
jgi:hypothetical protein